MFEAVCTMLAVFALALLPMLAVYGSPEHNALDEIEKKRKRGNHVNIFQRAHLGLSLSPEERAFLKLAQGFLITALVAAAGTLATVVSNGATLHDGVLAVAVSFAVTLILAVAKYFSANGQPALGGALTGIAGDIEQRLGGSAGNTATPAGSAPPAA